MMRRGFTLVELVVSLAIVGILSLAMSSSIVLSTRALPSAGGRAERQTAAGRALLQISEDIRLSTDITIKNSKTLELTIPDITGDSSDDIIEYAWGGNAGDPLIRSLNGSSSQTVVASVTSFTMTVVDGVAVSLLDRDVVSPQRISIELTSGVVAPVTVSAEIRLLNARMP